MSEQRKVSASPGARTRGPRTYTGNTSSYTLKRDLDMWIAPNTWSCIPTPNNTAKHVLLNQDIWFSTQTRYLAVTVWSAQYNTYSSGRNCYLLSNHHILHVNLPQNVIFHRSTTKGLSTNHNIRPFNKPQHLAFQRITTFGLSTNHNIWPFKEPQHLAFNEPQHLAFNKPQHLAFRRTTTFGISTNQTIWALTTHLAFDSKFLIHE